MMGSLLAAILTAILAFVLIAWVVASFFIWIGAKLARVEHATFGRAMLASLATGIVSGMISAVCSVVPVVGTALGFFLGLLFALAILRGIFDTTMGKAFLIWVFDIVAQVTAVVLAVALGVGGVVTMLH